jgi:hypothetical protein
MARARSGRSRKAGPDRAPAAPEGTYDLLGELVAFLTGPSPHLVIVEGAPGSGKSSLLRALSARLQVPCVHMAYRSGEPTPASGLGGAPASAGVSVVLLETRGVQLEEAPASLAALAASLQPPTGGTQFDVEGLPEPIARALSAMAAKGRGCLFLDGWDRSSQRRMATDQGVGDSFHRLIASAGELNERLGAIPVNTVLAMLAPVSPALKSIADGLLTLGLEPWDGPPLRVLAADKLGSRAPLGTRQVFTLEGGKFYAPAHAPPGFTPPVPPLDEDRSSNEEGIWPGSAAFAAAYGRLRPHSLTGVEIAVEVPNVYGGVFWLPAVAHVAASGGRAVVIPPVSLTPSELCAQLGRLVPKAVLGRNLRIQSPLGSFGSGDVPAGVQLPPPERGAPPSSEDGAGPIEPQLMGAYRFLQGAEPGRPVLYVIALDGLRAIAAASGLRLDPRALPLVISAIARLPRFHAFGVGRADDPLSPAFVPTLHRYLRLRMVDGQLVVHEAHPPGPCYLVEWGEPDGRYRLVRAA